MYLTSFTNMEHLWISEEIVGTNATCTNTYLTDYNTVLWKMPKIFQKIFLQ